MIKDSRNPKLVIATVLTVLLSMGLFSQARAHLMVAQHGTLNLLGDGAFMVLSVPVSAFGSVDDNGDGKLSKQEFDAHRTDIAGMVSRSVTLRDSEGFRPLEGLMLSPVVSHGAPDEPATQLVVMGRFALIDPAGSHQLHVGLYGKLANEQLLDISVTRQIDGLKEKVTLTPKESTFKIFAGKK